MGHRALDQLRVFRNSAPPHLPDNKSDDYLEKIWKVQKSKKNFKNKYILSIIPILTAKCLSAALFGDFPIYLHSQPYLEVM